MTKKVSHLASFARDTARSITLIWGDFCFVLFQRTAVNANCQLEILELHHVLLDESFYSRYVTSGGGRLSTNDKNTVTDSPRTGPSTV